MESNQVICYILLVIFMVLNVHEPYSEVAESNIFHQKDKKKPQKFGILI